MMPDLQFRTAESGDMAAMAEIRARDWGNEPYWRERIAGYLGHDLHPREALHDRVAVVCVEGDRVLGLIAGHLTRRFGCDAELEWISVRQQCRGRGIASQLLCRLAEWFVARRVLRVCVDVKPSNQTARGFYARHGAVELKPHWMVWEDISQVLRMPHPSSQP